MMRLAAFGEHNKRNSFNPIFSGYFVWPRGPCGYGHDLVGRMPQVQVQVPMKTCRVEGLMHVNSVEARDPPVG
ncbi:hypothetical protein TNCV_1622241 [Trichonephila clavipes]|nr:hypothetical protein TNCV_1622241 [Trichonephila clavipes]